MCDATPYSWKWQGNACECPASNYSDCFDTTFKVIIRMEGGGGGGERGFLWGRRSDAAPYLAFAYRVVHFAVVTVCALVTVLAKECVCASVATLDRTVRLK